MKFRDKSFNLVFVPNTSNGESAIKSLNLLENQPISDIFFGPLSPSKEVAVVVEEEAIRQGLFEGLTAVEDNYLAPKADVESIDEVVKRLGYFFGKVREVGNRESAIVVIASPDIGVWFRMVAANLPLDWASEFGSGEPYAVQLKLS